MKMFNNKASVIDPCGNAQILLHQQLELEPFQSFVSERWGNLRHYAQVSMLLI